MKFKEKEVYSASAITNGEFRGIFDQLIALVDGQLEHLSEWHSELMEDYMADGYTEQEAYNDAWNYIEYNIWEAYPDAKEAVIFKGIPPVGPGQGFDVFSEYQCTEVLRNE